MKEIKKKEKEKGKGKKIVEKNQARVRVKNASGSFDDTLCMLGFEGGPGS
jgi:hypothetical protein